MDIQELINDELKIKIQTKYGIDLDGFISQFIQFEDIYERLINLNDLNTVVFPEVKTIESYTRKLPSCKERASLLHYLSREKKAINERIDAVSIRDNALKIICSSYNMLLSLKEGVSEKRLENVICLFEALPSSMSYIRTRDEIANICSIFEKGDVSYYPIARYGTNINVFKNTCSKYNPRIIHIACHGEQNGDLAFIGVDKDHKFLGFEPFKKYFETEFKPNISLIYFNSCYSGKFVNHIYKNPSLKARFDNIIGCEGENIDLYAREFSCKYYDDFIASNDIHRSFENIKKQFSASMTNERVEYIKALFLR